MGICKIVNLTQITEQKCILDDKGIVIGNSNSVGSIISQVQQIIYSNEGLGFSMRFPTNWALYDSKMMNELIKASNETTLILEEERKRRFILKSICKQHDKLLLHGTSKEINPRIVLPFVNIYTSKNEAYMKEADEYAEELLKKFNLINCRYKIEKVREINPYVIKGKRLKKVYVVLKNTNDNVQFAVEYYSIKLRGYTLTINTCYESIEQEKILKEIINSITINNECPSIK